MTSNTATGTNSVAIGRLAGTTTCHNNSIVLNGSGVALNTAATDRLYIRPIRQLAPTSSEYRLYYNPTTYEITYSNVGGTTG